MVGLDIDGVVADFLSPFLLRLEKRVGKGPIPAESLRSVRLSAHPVLTEEAVRDCSDAVRQDPGFWDGLDSLLSGEQWSRLEELSQRGLLSFITHRTGHESWDIHAVTSEWFRRHGITNPDVHLVEKEKSAVVDKLGVVLFVDDNYENCQDVAEHTNARVLMPHHPYNRSFSHPGVMRIMHFNQVFTEIERCLDVGAPTSV